MISFRLLQIQLVQGNFLQELGVNTWMLSLDLYSLMTYSPAVIPCSTGLIFYNTPKFYNEKLHKTQKKIPSGFSQTATLQRLIKKKKAFSFQTECVK